MVSVTRCPSSFAAKLRLRVSSSASARYAASASAARRVSAATSADSASASEPRLAVREQRRQRFRPHAVLARDVVEGGEPLLDPSELAGVEVELLPVRAQCPRSLVELDARRLEQRDDVGQRGVVHGVLRQPAGERREPPQQRVVALDELVLRRGGRLEQRRCVRKPRLRRRQRVHSSAVIPSAASSRCRASRNSRSADDACAATAAASRRSTAVRQSRHAAAVSRASVAKPP